MVPPRSSPHLSLGGESSGSPPLHFLPPSGQEKKVCARHSAHSMLCSWCQDLRPLRGCWSRGWCAPRHPAHTHGKPSVPEGGDRGLYTSSPACSTLVDVEPLCAATLYVPRYLQTPEGPCTALAPRLPTTSCSCPAPGKQATRSCPQRRPADTVFWVTACCDPSLR